MADEQHRRKCGHANCDCTVAAGQMYCCDYCRRMAEQPRAMADDVDGECGCGHPACGSGE
jgi:hypothetical protein